MTAPPRTGCRCRQPRRAWCVWPARSGICRPAPDLCRTRPRRCCGPLHRACAADGSPRMSGLEVFEIVELALLLIATGALSGFLAGVFGIGGGAILVPVFYECFRIAGVPLEVRMPLCIGTSLAVIIPTSIRSFQAHYKRGAVDVSILRVWWLPIVIGVAAGSVIARYAPERLFKIVFVCVAYSASARLIFAREGWKFGHDLP